LAARLYVSILRVPGSSAFNVFHSLVFQKCLELLRIWQSPSTSLLGRIQVDLLKDVVLLLCEARTRDHVLCVDQLIQTFSSLTNIEPNNKPSFPAPDLSTIQSPCQLAFAGLEALSQSFYGSPSHTLFAIFKCLLPSLLMTLPDGQLIPSSASTPLRLVQVKDNIADFVCYVIQVHADNSDVQTAVRTLIQQMCVHVPDRAEYRAKVAQTVSLVMNQLSGKWYSSLVLWMRTLAKTTQVSNRMMALEVLICLAATSRLPDNNADSCHSVTQKQAANSEFFICIILDRCSDRSPNVRAKALSCLSTYATHHLLKHKLSMLLYPQDDQIDEEDPLVAHRAGVVLPLLMSRMADEKSSVRRVALQALEGVLFLNLTSVTEEMLNTFYQRCMDPGLSVRKQALSSITNLLMVLPNNVKLQSLWLDAVLPVIVDREASAQEKCLELIDTVILKHLVNIKRSSEVECGLAWSLLTQLASDGGQRLRRYLQRACIALVRQKKLNSTIVQSLINHVQSNEAHVSGVWLILSYVSSYCSDISAQFVLASYSNIKTQPTESSLECQILNVMGNIVNQLSRKQIQTLEVDLIQRLIQMEADPELVASIITCLMKFSEVTNNGSSHLQVTHWANPVLQSCHEYIQQVITGNDLDNKDEATLVCCLCTIGEIAQQCPEIVNDDVPIMVQSLIIGQADDSMATKAGLSGKTRAHAFFTLGKLCLQKKELAKQSVVLLAKELEESDDPVVRNNVIMVMSDLCVRYTSLVDHYIPNIALCLQDSAPFVRRQTLILLTNLLQEDYLKWRGSLFLHFVICVVDSDREIKHFAKFCLVHLLSRHSEIFYQHFIQCVFQLNGYETHPFYRFKQSEKEKKVFHLQGNDRKLDRMTIYKFLLENISDEHRFQITAKLCQDVLGGVVDEVIPLNSNSSNVLADTLAVLCSSEIKLAQLKRKNAGEEDQDTMEEENPAGAALAKAKSKIVSQLVKKAIIETIVPIVIALKQILEKAHSPLLRELMAYLNELMKDYKDELQDIMSADRQLASEIEFDLRRYDAQQKGASQVTEQAMRMMTSPSQMVLPVTRTPVIDRSPVQTPWSLSAPKLKIDIKRNSQRARSWTHDMYCASPPLPDKRQKLFHKQTLVDSTGKAAKDQQLPLQEVKAQVNASNIASFQVKQNQVGRDGISLSKSLRMPANGDRATSTPTGEQPSVTFHTPKRPSVSLAMPPSPIDLEKSVIYLDYPSNMNQKRVWNLVSPSQGHKRSGQQMKKT
jgi:condensin-2 complex subunit D3